MYYLTIYIFQIHTELRPSPSVTAEDFMAGFIWFYHPE